MLNIGNQKFRNLQEQVGFNTEQIEKIFNFLDGLEVEDNLIKLANSSGTLTTEEMEIVSRDVAFIIYNNNLYVKTDTSASQFIFKQVALNASDNGTYNILQSFRITITRASGAYAYSANTVLTLYNKSEVDSLLSAKADSTYLASQLALKANLAGANFSGAITAPSIIESMSGYSFSKDSASDIEYIYVGCSKNGNKITFVVFVKLNIASTSSGKNLGTFYIPEEVGQKLFPFTLDGNNTVLDIKTLQAFKTATTSDSITIRMRKVNDQALVVSANTTNLTLNTDCLVRYEATFLLSDNLAS